MTHFAVWRDHMFVKYFHHFIVISATQTPSTLSGTETHFTVVQYTSSLPILTESDYGIGKFIRQDYIVSEDVHCDILDYEQGLYKIEKPEYPKSTEHEKISEAYGRILQRLEEREYSLSVNNCEHVVNFILTGNSDSKQSRDRKPLADCCTVAMIDFKEVGFKTALIVSALGAIAGSLIRRTYVQVILAALVSLRAGFGVSEICDNIFGKNIIKEAEREILLGKTLPNISLIENSSFFVEEMVNALDNSFVCHAASDLVIGVVFKIMIYSLCTANIIETIVIVSYACFHLRPLRQKFMTDKIFYRIIFLRCYGGYTSIFLSIGIAIFGQFYLPRPQWSFFFVVFGGGLVLRYGLTVLAGVIYDSNLCCRTYCCVVFSLFILMCVLAPYMLLLGLWLSHEND